MQALADVALETGDEDNASAAKRLWNNVTTRRMSITGGIGVKLYGECFGDDYEIPRDAYNESCASIALANCGVSLLCLEPAGFHADVIETALLNTVLHGVGLDGTSYFYQNNLMGDRERKNTWVCCPSNILRTLLGIGRYIYVIGESRLYVNLYIGSQTHVTLDGTEVSVTISGNYVWDGAVQISVSPERSCDFSLYIRIPGWSTTYDVAVNGQPIEEPVRGGYLDITRRWGPGDRVEVQFDMTVRRMPPNPEVFESVRYVKTYRSLVCLARGPLIYAVEAIDNGGTTDIEIAREPLFKTEWQPNTLGGVVTITGPTSSGGSFTAVPYYALANRGRSDTAVWIRQEGKYGSTGDRFGPLYLSCKGPIDEWTLDEPPPVTDIEL